MSGLRVSVLMPNYNHARFLPSAVDAILAQSCRPFEFVILDDGSTDDSVAVLERYQQRAPELIRVIKHERNLGVLSALQRLVETATGEYVYFSAADDVVFPAFLERSMRLLGEHPEAGLSTCLSRVIDVDGRDVGYLTEGPFASTSDAYFPPAACRQSLVDRDFRFTGNTTVYHRERLLKAGAFRRELGPFCDSFVSQVLALRHGACFIPEGLAAGRWTGTNFALTLNKVDEALGLHDAVFALMQREYVAEFPRNYVKKWRWRSYYNIVRNMLVKLELDAANLARVATHAGGIDGAVLRLARVALVVCSRICMVGAALVLRRHDMPRWPFSAIAARRLRNRSIARRFTAFT